MLLFGLLLIAIGVIIVYSYTFKELNASTMATGTKQTIIIAPNQMVSSPIILNSTGIVYLLYNSNAVPINFYLLNSTAFASLTQYMQSGSLSPNALSSLESGDLYKKAYNGTEGILVLQGSSSALGLTPALYYNSSLVLSGGTYYAIYANPGNASASTTYGYVLPNSGLINGANQIATSGLGLDGGISALLILAGIILCVYSFISAGKPRQKAVQRDKAIQKLYRDIEKKERADAEKKGRKRKER